MVTWRWGLRCWWASRWRRRWWGRGWPRTRRRCRWTPRRRREAPANTVIHYRWDFLNEFLTLSFNWWFYFQDTYLAIMSVLCKRSKGGQYKQRKCVCGKKRIIREWEWLLITERGTVVTSASKSSIRRFVILGPSPGWKRLLPLSHLRHY